MTFAPTLLMKPPQNIGLYVVVNTLLLFIDIAPVDEILPIILSDDPLIAPACVIDAFTPEVVPTMTPPDPIELRLEQVIPPVLDMLDTVVDEALLIVKGIVVLAVVIVNGVHDTPAALTEILLFTELPVSTY